MKFFKSISQTLLPIAKNNKKNPEFSLIQIQDNFFKIIIIRKKRLKNIHLRLTTNSSIKISCSLSTNHTELEKIIRKNEKWILRKNKELIEKEKYKLNYQEGEFHLWNGQSLSLHIIWQNKKRAHLLVNENKFIAYLSQNLSFEQQKKELGKLFKKFYQQQTLEFCKKRLIELQKFHYFPFQNIKIKQLKSRWGSCSKKGNLNFNQDLAKLAEPLRNYIIAHEYAHLKELNHSKRFWEIVKLFEPNYSQIKKELKHHERKYH